MATPPGTYYLMQLVKLVAQMRDENNDPQDPSTVTLLVKPPGGTTTTYTYGSDPNFVRDDRGAYHFPVAGTTAGTIFWAWRTSGTYQGAAEGSFIVLPSNV